MDSKLEEYILSHIDAEPGVLKKIDRDAHVKLLRTSMISGHLQGRFLKMLTQMIRPERILEIGTFIGYSTLCFAEGLEENAEVHTIEIDDELEGYIRSNFAQSEFGNKIKLHMLPKIRKGGFILVDNTLWYGKVVEEVESNDWATQGILEFNRKLANDGRVEKVILPIRDGVTIIRKK